MTFRTTTLPSQKLKSSSTLDHQRREARSTGIRWATPPTPIRKTTLLNTALRTSCISRTVHLAQMSLWVKSMIWMNVVVSQVWWIATTSSTTKTTAISSTKSQTASKPKNPTKWSPKAIWELTSQRPRHNLRKEIPSRTYSVLIWYSNQRYQLCKNLISSRLVWHIAISEKWQPI